MREKTDQKKGCMHDVTGNSVKAPVLHEILAFRGKGIFPRIHGNYDTDFKAITLESGQPPYLHLYSLT